MTALSSFNRYDMTGVKLRSNTSTMIDERIYYIVKKFPDKKASSLYAAYDFETGISVAWNTDRDEVLKFLNENKDRIEQKFKEINYEE